MFSLRKKIILIIILLLSFYSLHSVSNTQKIDITYNEFTKTIFYSHSLKLKLDNNQQFNITMPQNIFCKIDSMYLVSNGYKQQFKIKRKKDKLLVVINNTNLVDTTIDATIHYRVRIGLSENFSFKNALIFPATLIKINDLNKNNIATKYLMNILLPPKWEMVKHQDQDITRVSLQKKLVKYRAIIISNVPPLLVSVKNINWRQSIICDNLAVEFSSHRFFKKSFTKNKKIAILAAYKINRLNNFVKRFYNLNEPVIDQPTKKQPTKKIKICIVNFSGVSLTTGGITFLSVNHYRSLKKKKDTTLIYNVIHELALEYFSTKLNPLSLSTDYWLIEGLSHLPAIAYFEQNYSLDLNDTILNPFMRFLLGPKKSIYGQIKSSFRQYILYNSIKQVAKGNREKTYGYNMKAEAINNYYSVQVFYNLRKLIGQKRFVKIINRYVNSANQFLTTISFLKFLKNNLSQDEYSSITRFINRYPKIDFAIKRHNKDKSISIIRTLSDYKMPLEILVTYKDNTTKRIVLYINKKNTILPVDFDIVKNIVLDPEGLIEETNEFNNFLQVPVRFSFLAPQSKLDNYNLALSGVLCSYNNATLGGVTITGGWNMAGFTPNSLEKPNLLWGLDIGYGYDEDGNLKQKNNVFVHSFFESSLYPRSVWAPRFYTFVFLVTGESLAFKVGLQTFLPPVYNTENDKVFFNHSLDFGYDIKMGYFPMATIDFNINAGYRLYLKAHFFTFEGLVAFNFDFDKAQPKNIQIASQLNFKFDLNFIEIGLRPGIMASFFDYRRYEYTRPKFTRFSFATQTIGFYEQINKNLVYANNLIHDFPYPKMNFLFNSAYFLFKFGLFKQPFLPAKFTVGLGVYIDTLAPYPIDPYRLRLIFAGAMIKIDIMQKTSIIIRGTFLPLIFVHNTNFFMYDKPLGMIYYEIRSYL